MTRENAPLTLACEGAGCPPIRTTIDPATFSTNFGRYVGMCSMCGQWTDVAEDGQIAGHERQDVLAMIERGDFG